MAFNGALPRCRRSWKHMNSPAQGTAVATG